MAAKLWGGSGSREPTVHWLGGGEHYVFLDCVGRTRAQTHRANQPRIDCAIGGSPDVMVGHFDQTVRATAVRFDPFIAAFAGG